MENDLLKYVLWRCILSCSTDDIWTNKTIAYKSADHLKCIELITMTQEDIGQNIEGYFQNLSFTKEITKDCDI